MAPRHTNYQQRHRAAGLCLFCPKALPPGSTTRCKRHLLLQRLRLRKALGQAPWRPGRRGRPPVEAA